MHRREVPIHTPCGADWSAMSPAEARTRMCGECRKVVHDLSARSDGEIRDLLAAGPVCVRFLHDAHGRILVGDPPAGARVVPASVLLSRAARIRWLAAAALAAVPIVFEACGGNAGGYGGTYVDVDGGDAEGGEPALIPAQPGAAESGARDADASDAERGDAQESGDAG